ncbi:outer membrane beta-barrel family protein [Chryseosolibacter indicus]|uniref:DUF5723 domain-containing protein n=1 Tax=Chryseosolibacter indicus TaxID=2782351 RepID=A0ABS5VPI0_9BACT|nr:outer membrane beta-barrel family protein [Chryseosolibacter indicus]MBT1702740.1 hypothetical protein [Chryseosolibacter indicus]
MSVLSCLTGLLFGQNLASIGKEKPLQVSGGLSLNQIFYSVNGIESRRDPYTYYASGNINFSLYGWSVPLSFSVSNQNTSFQQPFNQYSLHPTYKWVTGHFGYTSMSFSPYTVNGHIFLGGGVDVAPEGKFKISALYGRFLKAVEPDTSNQNAMPSYKRMGYGFKASYGEGGDFVDLIVFHAHDDINSVSFIPDSLDVLPEENLVMSISAGKTVLKNFLLKAELAGSALSRDTRAEEANHGSILAKPKFIYIPRLSSSYYKAFKTSFNYQQSFYTLGVAYERIDPLYRTLGSYYFNNDLENITANAAVAILKGKVNVAASGGTQRDNLDRSKVSTMRRMVGSLNLAYAPTQKLNFSASYSNFQTYTNIRSQFVDINQLTPYDNLDTLNFTQISQNATLTTMYMFGGNEKKRQSVNLNLTFQDAADKQGDVEQNSGVQFYSVNAAYALNIVPQNLMLSVSFNATLNEAPGNTSRTTGPTASVSKSFFQKKLRATLSSSYNNTYANSVKVNSIINGRLNTSVTLQKKHNINFSLVAVNRSSNREGSAQAFTEFTGTLGYSYSFNY